MATHIHHCRAAALALALLTGLVPDAAQAADDSAHNSALAGARMGQQILPALLARQAAALARLHDGQAFLNGDAPLAAAFPDLDGAPLNAPGFLDAQLHQLDLAGAARAAERVAKVPDGLSVRAAGRWRTQQQNTLDIEDRADLLRRRVLLGLVAGLDRAPALAQDRLESECLTTWRATAQRSPSPDASPQQSAAVLSQAAAAGQAIAAMNRLLAACWRAFTVPEDAALTKLVGAQLASPPAWTEDPADRLSALAWSDRLGRVLSLLPPDQQTAVSTAQDTLELAELDADLPVLRHKLDVLQASADKKPAEPGAGLDLKQLQAALDEAHRALDALPAADSVPNTSAGAPSPLAKRRAEVQSLRHKLAQLRVDQASAALAAARMQATLRTKAPAARIEAGAVRAKADQALVRAQASATEQEAAVRGSLAQLQAEIADQMDAENTRTHQVRVALSALEKRWRAARSAARQALKLPSLAVGRDNAIDDAYRDLREIVSSMRQAVGARRSHLAESRSRRDDLSARLPDPSKLSPEVRGMIALDLASVEADIDALHAQRRDDAQEELDGALTLLALAKKDRRQIRPAASARARKDVLQHFMTEAKLEALEAPAIVSAEVRHTVATARALPYQVTDLAVVLSFFRHSFELILLGLLWLGLRSSADRWTHHLLDALARWRKRSKTERRERPQPRNLSLWYVDGDLRELARPLAPLLLAAVDVAVAYVLFRLTQASLAPLALVLLIWLSRSIYRAVLLTLDLLWSMPGQARPALAVVSADTLSRGQRSLRVVMLAVLSVTVMHFITLDIFDADRFSDLVGVGRNIAYIVVALWLLWTWEKAILAAVAATGDSSRLTSALTAHTGGPVLGLARSMGGLMYLAWRSAAELLVRVAEGRPGLGWLASALARARLRSSALAAVNAIPADSTTLAEVDTGQVAVPRAQQIKDLEAAIIAWGTEHRRGMIALIGDRGSGKSMMLDLADRRAQALLPDLPVKRLSTPQRLSEAGPALQWLTDATGTSCSEIMDCESDVEALADSLRTLPSTIYLVDDLHRLVLRKVGGFGAARAVLRVMLATSQQHLWVCAIHKPTWNYLSGLRSSINLEALRSRITLGPLPAAELGEWIKARVRSAGYSVAFDRLVDPNPMGMDARRARARAEQAYWRILADASVGIPVVAWGYFRAGLCIGKGVRALDAHIFRAPSTAELEHLPDLDLFVLTAVVIHDDLSSSAISDVLNAPLAQVQEACRHLDGLGVLCSDNGEQSWVITPDWYPAVQRILRQRHFLYLR